MYRITIKTENNLYFYQSEDYPIFLDDYLVVKKCQQVDILTTTNSIDIVSTEVIPRCGEMISVNYQKETVLFFSVVKIKEKIHE